MNWLNELIKTTKCFLNKMKRDRVDAYSAQSAFYVIMSFIPFVMMLLTLLQYTRLTQQDLMELLMGVLPDEIMSYVENLVSSLYNNSTALVSGTALAAVWASGRAALAVTNGLNSVQDVDETRNYIYMRIRSAIYTVGLMISIILAMTLLVFGNQLQRFIVQQFNFLQHISGFIINVRTIATLILLTVLFAAMYTVLPNKKPSFFSQIPGAVAAALSWSLFSYAFSLYISKISNMSTIYGSLTTVVIVMLWLYFCMWLLFFGAEVNVYLDDPEKFT